MSALEGIVNLAKLAAVDDYPKHLTICLGETFCDLDRNNKEKKAADDRFKRDPYAGADGNSEEKQSPIAAHDCQGSIHRAMAYVIT